MFIRGLPVQLPGVGGSAGSGTVGSILFVGTGPVIAEDNANLFWDDTNNYLGVGTNSPAATVDVLQAADTSGTPDPAFQVTGGAHTTLANAEVVGVNLDFSQTVDINGGGAAIADWRTVYLQGPTITGVAAQTITNLATLAVDPPTASTNITATNVLAAMFTGNIAVGTGTASSPAIQFGADVAVDSNTGFYQISGDNLSLSLGGNEAIRVSAGTFNGINSSTAQFSVLRPRTANTTLNLSSQLTTTATTGIAIDAVNSYSATSGTQIHAAFSVTFAPTSGTAAFIGIDDGFTINQTGTASGDVTIMRLVPTITSFLGTNLIGIDMNLSSYTHLFSFPADATDPTSGGGAATGRIPVLIGGSTVYLAYY